MYCKDLKPPDKKSNNTEFLKQFNDYIDTKTPNNDMCKYNMLGFFVSLHMTCSLALSMSFKKLHSICFSSFTWRNPSHLALSIGVCIEHLIEACQPVPKGRSVRWNTGLVGWFDVHEQAKLCNVEPLCSCSPFDANSKALTITRLAAHVWSTST